MNPLGALQRDTVQRWGMIVVYRHGAARRLKSSHDVLESSLRCEPSSISHPQKLFFFPLKTAGFWGGSTGANLGYRWLQTPGCQAKSEATRGPFREVWGEIGEIVKPVTGCCMLLHQELDQLLQSRGYASLSCKGSRVSGCKMMWIEVRN